MSRNNKCKRVVASFLAILLMMPVWRTEITAAEPVAEASAPHVIINQVFGGGNANDGAISHGFIELYNPTNEDIDLSTHSIQYSKGKENSAPTVIGPFEWNVLPLTGQTIKAHHSFLILCDSGVPVNAAGTPRYTISKWDMRWEQVISNRSFHVALVSNQVKLSPIITENESEHVMDLIGTKNTGSNDAVYHSEGSPLEGISKQKSARRIEFTDTDENSRDFEIVDYRITGVTNDVLEEVKPRYSGDGVWGTEPVEQIDEDKRLVFSKEAGLYKSSFDLTMTTGYSNGVIRYTTDGSEPTVNSNAYTAAISIRERTNEEEILAKYTDITCTIPSHNHDFNPSYMPPTSNIFKGNVIKAQVFSDKGKALTDVYTKSYFVNANYDNLPVISLVTDKSNLFDPVTGLYVNHNYINKGSNWERPIHFEMFEPNGSIAVSQNMGVRINGGATRNIAQKSFRLYAKSGYDANNPTVEYDLFEGHAKKADGSVLTSFKRLLLRNAGNDNHSSMLRDAMLQSLVHDTDIAIQAYRQSVVFLNGEFWGIYNIRERTDDEGLMRKFDIDDIDNIGMLEFVHSNASPNVPDEYDETIPEMKADYDAYKEMWNWFQSKTTLDTAEDYLKAQTFIDMNNFIDYYIINIFVNNGDWPGNNNQLWRYRTGYPTESQITDQNWQDGRWRWVLKDTDFGFGLYSGEAWTDSLTRLTRTTGTDFSNPTWSTLFFRKLITNTAFKNRFINRFCDLMNTNFKKEVVTSKITTMSENISGTMEAHINRWNFIGSLYSWNNSIDTMKRFAEGRVSGMQSQLKTFFSIPDSTTTVSLMTDKNKGYLTLNGMPITMETDGVTDPSSWSGTYFINKTQIISATPYEGYRFHKFIVGTKEYSEDTIPITPTGATTVQAVFVKTTSIDVTANTDGNGSATGGGTFEPGSTVTLTANPNTGYSFDGWYDNGTKISGDTVYTFTAESGRVLMARFLLNRYIITAAGEGGSVTGDGTFDHNATVTLTATPQTGYYFVRWLEGTKQVSTKQTYSFTADRSQILTAEFAKLAIPSYVKVESKDYRSLTISWEKTDNAVKYEIYRADSKHGSYNKVTTVTNTSYTDTKRVTGKNYYYKLCAIYMIDGKAVNSNESSVVSGKTNLSFVAGLKVKKGNVNSSRLNWKKTAGASGYEVYRANKKKGKYIKARDTKRIIYRNTGLKKKYTYWYKVRAYRMVSGKKVYGQFSKIRKVKI